MFSLYYSDRRCVIKNKLTSVLKKKSLKNGPESYIIWLINEWITGIIIPPILIKFVLSDSK